MRAIESVAAGDAVYGAGVAGRIVAFFTGGEQDVRRPAFPDLTEREREVLDLLAAGLRNRESRQRLSLSDKTVRNHVQRVLHEAAGARPHRSRPQGEGGAGLGQPGE